MKLFLEKLKNNENLTFDESKSAFEILMEGKASNEEIFDFLTNLSKKGEVSDELAGGVYVLRNKAKRVNVQDCIDTCGTGGDGKNTLNISTASALLFSEISWTASLRSLQKAGLTAFAPTGRVNLKCATLLSIEYSIVSIITSLLTPHYLKSRPLPNAEYEAAYPWGIGTASPIHCAISVADGSRSSSGFQSYESGNPCKRAASIGVKVLGNSAVSYTHLTLPTNREV